MATRVFTNFRVLAYPASYIPQPNPNYYCVADDLADLVRTDQGAQANKQNTGFAAPGIANTANTNTDQPEFNSKSEVEYCLLGARGRRAYFGDQAVTFAKTEGGTFGLILQVREAHNDDVLETAVTGDPTSSGTSPALPQLLWRVQTGTGWHTVLRRGNPPSTRVMLVSPVANQVAEIISALPHVADQSFRGDLDFAGSATSNSGGFVNFAWGSNSERLLWMENQHPIYQRYISDENGARWKDIRIFYELPKAQMKGTTKQHWTFYVRIIGGHRVFTFEVAGAMLSFDVADPQPTSTPQPGSPNPTNYKIQRAAWRSGTFNVQSYGVRVSVGTALLQYAKILQYDGVAEPLTGTFSRTIFLKRRPTSTTQGTGYTRAKDSLTHTEVESTWSENNYGSQIDYTCTLHGSSLVLSVTETLPGIHTPYVTGVIARSTTSQARPSAAAIDITLACKGTCTIESAEPPDTVVGEARLTVDRAKLNELFSGTSWTANVKQFNIVTIEVKGFYSDGSEDSYTQLFEGYVMNPTRDVDGAYSWTGGLVLRDHMQRTIAPAAFIGEEFDAPLDHLILASDDPQIQLRGATCYREILLRAVGSWASEDLNGGPDEDDRYYPVNYPYLIDPGNDIVGLYPDAVPMKEGWVLNPKYGADANSWAQDFERYEHAARYYGPLPEGGTAMYFVYGHLATLYKKAREAGDGDGINLYIADKDYVSGDINKIILAASRQELGDMNYNDFRAWAMRTTGKDAGTTPALIYGHSRLPSDDPNAEENSWRRTKLLEPSILEYAPPEAAQVLTEAVMREFRDRDPADITVTARGQLTARLFMVIQCRLDGAQSDTTIGINGIPLRVKRYAHELNFDRSDIDDWKTTFYTRTLTTSGL